MFSVLWCALDLIRSPDISPFDRDVDEMDDVPDDESDQALDELYAMIKVTPEIPEAELEFELEVKKKRAIGTPRLLLFLMRSRMSPAAPLYTICHGVTVPFKLST